MPRAATETGALSGLQRNDAPSFEATKPGCGASLGCERARSDGRLFGLAEADLHHADHGVECVVQVIASGTPGI
jgi:hypothetical protein